MKESEGEAFPAPRFASIRSTVKLLTPTEPRQGADVDCWCRTNGLIQQLWPLGTMVVPEVPGLPPGSPPNRSFEVVPSSRVGRKVPSIAS